MRVLSAIVLTHCFGCLVPENSGDDCMHRPSPHSRHLQQCCHSPERIRAAYRSHRVNGNHRSCREPVADEPKEKETEAEDDERVARGDNRDSDMNEPTTEDTKEPAETYANGWGEWMEWGECSASCDCGRQVRWRHCVGKGCMNGLKKAQIKTCHLRDCSSKNLLSWLGVKA